MKKRAAWLLLALLVLPATIAEEDEPRLPRWKPGTRTGKVTIDGKEERFAVLVPRGFTQKKLWPVVLLAHGNGGHAESFLTRVTPLAGKRPPLLVSLERCDNLQDAVGYVPKYLDALKTQFNLDEENVYVLGFSGGGFRLWDDVVCKKDVLPRFRGVILVGCGRQSFDPPPKPEKAPTIVFVGDPKDPNYGASRPAAADGLKELGYEVIVHEHTSGHSLAPKPLKLVFEWIDAQIRASKRRRR